MQVCIVGMPHHKASMRNNAIQMLARTGWLVRLITQMQVGRSGRYNTGPQRRLCSGVLLLPEATYFPPAPLCPPTTCAVSSHRPDIDTGVRCLQDVLRRLVGLVTQMQGGC